MRLEAALPIALLNFAAFGAFLNLEARAAPVSPKAPAAFRVEAGRCMGALRIGAIMPPVRGDQNPVPARARWIGPVIKDENGSARWIDVYLVPNHATDEYRIAAVRVTWPVADLKKVSPSASSAAMLRAYPSMRRVASYKNSYYGVVDVYDDRKSGVAFELLRKAGNRPSRCLVICVHRANQSVLDFYRSYPTFKKTLHLLK